MSDAEWHECPPSSIRALKHCRVYQKNLPDGHLTVMVGREPFLRGVLMGWHLSISHRSNTIVSTMGRPAPGRLPTYDEIKEARYRFVPDGLYMAMILPPKDEFVNVHPTTMHLYRID
jgi:hypothetical protein